MGGKTKAGYGTLNGPEEVGEESLVPHVELFEQSSTGSSRCNSGEQLPAHHVPCLGSLSKGSSSVWGCDPRADAVPPCFQHTASFDLSI